MKAWPKHFSYSIHGHYDKYAITHFLVQVLDKLHTQQSKIELVKLMQLP